MAGNKKIKNKNSINETENTQIFIQPENAITIKVKPSRNNQENSEKKSKRIKRSFDKLRLIQTLIRQESSILIMKIHL